MEYLEIEVKGWIKDRLVDVLIGLVLVGQPLLTGRNAHIWLRKSGNSIAVSKHRLGSMSLIWKKLT